VSWTRKVSRLSGDRYPYGDEPHWKNSHVGRGLPPGDCARIDRLTRPSRSCEVGFSEDISNGQSIEEFRNRHT
jgi:hypothetical protein